MTPNKECRPEHVVIALTTAMHAIATPRKEWPALIRPKDPTKVPVGYRYQREINQQRLQLMLELSRLVDACWDIATNISNPHWRDRLEAALVWIERRFPSLCDGPVEWRQCLRSWTRIIRKRANDNRERTWYADIFLELQHIATWLERRSVSALNELDLPDLELAVLNTLRTKGPMGPSALVDEGCSVSADSVSRALRSLANKGLVKKELRGLWAAQ